MSHGDYVGKAGCKWEQVVTQSTKANLVKLASTVAKR